MMLLQLGSTNLLSVQLNISGSWIPAEDLDDSMNVGFDSQSFITILPANKTSPFISNLTLIRRCVVLPGRVSKIESVFESKGFL